MEGWTQIYTAQGEAEAAVVKSKLEAAGIKVHLEGESAGRLYAVTMNGLGEVKVFVPADKAKEARKLLASK